MALKFSAHVSLTFLIDVQTGNERISLTLETVVRVFLSIVIFNTIFQLRNDNTKAGRRFQCSQANFVAENLQIYW